MTENDFFQRYVIAFDTMEVVDEAVNMEVEDEAVDMGRLALQIFSVKKNQF